MKVSSGKLLAQLVMFLGFVLALVGILYISHSSYVKELSKRHIPNIESNEKYGIQELLRRVGYIKLPPRKSSFINFKDHPKEKIRVGVFGDSYTYGDEVVETQSYPAHLQKLLGSKYQVINFGMNWYSLDQTYILFETFFDKMNLDYAVLGPRGLYHYRSTSFNHTNDLEPYYLHSRFVLESGENKEQILREKMPVGNTPIERFHNYYRFIPFIKYLLYDVRSPSFLRSLEYRLGVRFINPLYYKENVSQEVNLIHSKILERFINKAGDRFLFLHNRFNESELVKKIDWKSSVHMQVKDFRWEGFPWLAQKGHFSGLGNALVASQVSSFFTGKKIETSHVRVTGDYSQWDDKDITVFLNNKKIGKLFDVGILGDHVIGLNCAGQNIGTTLFYPISEKPKDSSHIRGFQRMFSGEWLTIFTGQDCLIDYKRKELVMGKNFDNTVKIHNIVLANKFDTIDVNSREMFMYAFSKSPKRIVIDNSFGEEILSGKEIVIEIR